MVNAATAQVLARSNGFSVTAQGEVVGEVVTPVFSGTKLLPDYLLVRVTESIPGTYRAIPPDLIAGADARSQTAFLAISPDEVAALPEPDELGAARG